MRFFFFIPLLIPPSSSSSPFPPPSFCYLLRFTTKGGSKESGVDSLSQYGSTPKPHTLLRSILHRHPTLLLLLLRGPPLTSLDFVTRLSSHRVRHQRRRRFRDNTQVRFGDLWVCQVYVLAWCVWVDVVFLDWYVFSSSLPPSCFMSIGLLKRRDEAR